MLSVVPKFGCCLAQQYPINPQLPITKMAWNQICTNLTWIFHRNAQQKTSLYPVQNGTWTCREWKIIHSWVGRYLEKQKKVPDKNQLTKISSTWKIVNAPFCTYQPPAAVGNNTKHWLYLTGFCSWSTLRLPQTKTKIPFAEVGWQSSVMIWWATVWNGRDCEIPKFRKACDYGNVRKSSSYRQMRDNCLSALHLVAFPREPNERNKRAKHKRWYIS